MTLKQFEVIVFPIVSLVFGLLVALAIAGLLGESPLYVLEVMLLGAIGSVDQLGYSLFYATPLLLTGLSVAWSFRAGLFNIGAEGQMAIGGLALAAVGILAPTLPSLVAMPLALACAFLCGGAWGAIAGWMKARRGCHEVLSTILLNFIAYGISSYVILSILKNPESQVPETAVVGSGFQIPAINFLGGRSPLNWSFGLAVAGLILYGLIFKRTRLGFYQRIAGSAPELGRRAGISMDRQVVLAMFISGGIAALAAISPVLGHAHKTIEGFTGGAGFVGVAVALLGRNSPVGIFFSAILFGALSKGAQALDLDTEFVSRDLAIVIQGLIVLAVASQAGLLSLWVKLRQGEQGAA
jgi:ABC-type uncharacterized transport system permease subunit